MEDKNSLHLLANPQYHKKKTIKLNTIDDHLLILLQKKFPQCKIKKDDYLKNIEKIETLFIESSNCIIIQEVIDKIIQSIVNEQVLL
jgi:hypothetical protein